MSRREPPAPDRTTREGTPLPPFHGGATADEEPPATARVDAPAEPDTDTASDPWTTMTEADRQGETGTEEGAPPETPPGETGGAPARTAATGDTDGDAMFPFEEPVPEDLSVPPPSGAAAATGATDHGPAPAEPAEPAGAEPAGAPAADDDVPLPFDDDTPTEPAGGADDTDEFPVEAFDLPGRAPSQSPPRTEGVMGEATPPGAPAEPAPAEPAHGAVETEEGAPAAGAGTRDADRLAGRLEIVARQLREEGPAALERRLAGDDRLDATLAALLMGYLTGRDD